MLRTGLGFDVHAFKEGRKLILGGVEIPYEKGLDGHSDADVLVHALMDAILGALRLGDIGKLFPDTDDSFKDADSLVLLEKVAKLMREEGFEFLDGDIVVACQAPKLSRYREHMIERVSNTLGVPFESLGIKATTTEHLGFVGRKEGIAVWASVLLQKVIKDD
ncbi:MAG: 2-C-methyl-D-erythritol 2,4-cyclodiphosphate synthase [Coriobacteriia bacterium]|nr:2-C-methyl-D-erythritol 2,4-cyclodiphosphate synthase [Coriobacteriia bacterium]